MKSRPFKALAAALAAAMLSIGGLACGAGPASAVTTCPGSLYWFPNHGGAYGYCSTDAAGNVRTTSCPVGYHYNDFGGGRGTAH